MKENDISKFKEEMRKIWALENKDSFATMTKKEKKLIDELKRKINS